MFWNRQQFRNLKLMINYSKTSKILHHVRTSVICLLSLWFLCVWWKININLTYCSRLLPYVKLNVEKQLSSPKLKQSERQFRKLQILTWHLIKDLPSIWGCILSFWKVQWGSELLCWGTEIGRGGQCLRSFNIGIRLRPRWWSRWGSRSWRRTSVGLRLEAQTSLSRHLCQLGLSIA